ncbi:MAG: hypothetical protein ACK553_18085 [Planctomycetota bacterium]|jgi:uncharacterized membrane protein
MLRFLVVFGLLLIPNGLVGQEPTIEKRKFDQLEMELFRNTRSMSQAIAINNHGSVVGTREIDEYQGASLRSIPFYSGMHGTKDIPIPATYTNLEVIGISDNELVIGYATRPLRHKDGSLRGVVWNPKTEEFAILPQADGDVANQAQDISADGKRITGYTTGPARLRPALWEYRDETQEWMITVMPTIKENNPYLMSGQLIISPNGKWVAGCCTDQIRSDGIVDSSLFLWTENEIGSWERRKLSDEQMYLRGINDHMEMAGSVLEQKGVRHPCYVSPEGEVLLLELLPDDASGEAKDINNASVIVGFSDDPSGPDGGPELCVWSKDGKATRVAEPGLSYGAIHGINDAGQMAGMIEISAKREDSPSTNDDEVLLLAFRTVPPAK